MSAANFITESENARVLVVSQRGLHMIAPRCMNYEFEDCIAAVDHADIVTPAASMAPSRWQRRLARARGHSAARRGTPIVDRRYDVLFVCCQSVADLISLGPIGRWLACSDQSVCWIDELWTSTLAKRPYELAQLACFDHVVVGCHGSVDSLRDEIRADVTYLPPGIDVMRFCPYPDPPRRTIDVYAMGRRSPDTHNALLDFADRTGRFYLFDTLTGFGVREPAEHRRLLANVIQRTKYFLAYRAKVNAPDQTRAQEETGFRFFEGAAAGAILLGQPPRNPVFSELFDWPDVVFPLPFGSENVAEAIDAIEANPARADAARTSNVRGCIERHDWLYRWRSILQICNLDEVNEAWGRQRELRRLSESVDAAIRAAA